MASTVARTIAERVVRPVLTEKQEPAVGLYIGEESKFVIPVSFVFGQVYGRGAMQGRDHLLEELRKVIECAVLQADTTKAINEIQQAASGTPLDVVGPVGDRNDYYRGKITR